MAFSPTASSTIARAIPVSPVAFPATLLDRRAARGQCSRPMDQDARGDATPAISEMSFEDALRALEEIVRKLESGEVTLDRSIDLYERGEALRTHCQARLDAAQARIEKIVTDGQGRASGTAPFDAGS